MLAVTGATASGKTWLGVELAKRHNGEVISADSIQVYKGLDIASAKPTKEEMQGIPHHLIDFLDRDTAFSVSDYVKLADQKIKEVLSRGKLPIIVGGTGLYIDSLLNNIQFSEEKTDAEYRRKLQSIAEIYGNEYLHSILALHDPRSAEKIHPNNLIRVIRAMEVFHSTGKKFSEVKEESAKYESPYNSLILCIEYQDRQVLYDRINRRVDIMVQNGLVDEARELYQNGGMKTSANAIGYKELIPYFQNTASLNDCIDRIKQETRRYAKRQMTWFRKNTRINRIILCEFNQKNEILEKSEKAMANYQNI